MGKVLVTYFSATGTTKALAEKVAEAAGGELFEIRPCEPYTAADLGSTNGVLVNGASGDRVAAWVESLEL